MPKIGKSGLRLTSRYYEYDIHYSGENDIFYVRTGRFQDTAENMDHDTKSKYFVAESLYGRLKGTYISGKTKDEVIERAKEFFIYADSLSREETKIIRCRFDYQNSEGSNMDHFSRNWSDKDTIQIRFSYQVLIKVKLGEDSVTYESTKGERVSKPDENNLEFIWEQDIEDRLAEVNKELSEFTESVSNVFKTEAVFAAFLLSGKKILEL